MNRSPLEATKSMHRSVSRMSRAFFLIVVTLLTARPALAAGDIDTCRDAQAEPAARLPACESVIADDKITGKSRGAALAYRADALARKRDYDGAIAGFSAALEADPDNVNYLNNRGIAYSNKGDDEHALADYESCLKLRPNFANAYNNRGLIFLRKADLDRALEEFDAAIKIPSNNPTRALNFYNRARAQTYRKQYDAALADFAEARKLSPDNTQIPNYRCITYASMGKFDEAIADCNEVLAKFPKSIYTLTSRGNAYLGKGDLDAALNDFNESIKVNPNYIRAHASRGQLYEKRRDFAAARSEYRAASAALTKFDDIDTGIARRFAKERLTSLMAALPAAASAKPAPGKAAMPAPPSGPRKVALIVGNGAYKNVTPLDNPPRDARLIADTLRGLGFATVTLAPDLTRDKFFAALHEFGREAEKADWAVVYYAGHGMEIGGVNYLIPTDAKLAVDRDAETQAVALEQVIAAVSGARKLRLVMLDACRDNPFQKTMQRTIALKLVSKGFSNIEPEAGFMVVYAAKHGETALDGDSRNSPFATVLAREIRQPKVEVRKLFDIVRDDVWTATKHTQQPFTYGSPPGREDFYFVAEK
jgi:tetratricopeptide (TPR) repeat protein